MARRRPAGVFFWRAFFALVLISLPIALTLAYERGWLRVPRPLQPGDWPIRTSADVELLLREAASADEREGFVYGGHVCPLVVGRLGSARHAEGRG